jgi:hypothetical protein
MSIEYIFFNQALSERFLQFVAERGLAGEMRHDAMDGYVVCLPEGLDDALEDAIEDEYDALMREQMVLAETEEGWGTRQVMGVEITRADGSRGVVRIEGVIGRRLSEHFTPEEIHELVAAIVHSLENPDSGPLCKKP